VSKANILSQLQSSSCLLYWLQHDLSTGLKSLFSSNLNRFHAPKLEESGIGTRLYGNQGSDYLALSDKIIFASDKGRTIKIRNRHGGFAFVYSADSREAVCHYGGFLGSDELPYFYAVKEVGSNFRETQVSLVQINFITGVEIVIYEANGFIGWPTFNYKNNKIAFCTWEHPDLPWEATILYEISSPQNDPVITCIDKSGFSIQQPRYNDNGTLHWISDESGWWNIWCSLTGKKKLILETDVDIGRHKPFFGFNSYDFGKNGSIGCAGIRGAECIWTYYVSDKINKQIVVDGTVIDVCYSTHRGDFTVIYSNENFGNDICVFSKDEKIRSFYKCKIKAILSKISFKTHTVVSLTPTPVNIPTAYYSGSHLPKAILVRIHGGPVGVSERKYDSDITFWTERGYVVVEPNYRGSIGCGREYRLSIKGKWGIFDTQDCLTVIEDVKRNPMYSDIPIFVEGKSAGGYTVLHCLAANVEITGAAIYFGAFDLRRLHETTHNLESNYIPWLIFNENEVDIDQRSAFDLVEQISTPTILFHGYHDTIVPIEQSYLLNRSFKQHGIMSKLVEFDNEGHGFTKIQNVQQCLNDTYDFFESICNT
jgi:dienelactone hydrolase